MDRSGSQFGEGDAKVREDSGHESCGVVAAMGGADGGDTAGDGAGGAAADRTDSHCAR